MVQNFQGFCAEVPEGYAMQEVFPLLRSKSYGYPWHTSVFVGLGGPCRPSCSGRAWDGLFCALDLNPETQQLGCKYQRLQNPLIKEYTLNLIRVPIVF